MAKKSVEKKSKTRVAAAPMTGLKKKQKPQKTPAGRKEEREVHFSLTDKERLQRGVKASELTKEIEALEAARKMSNTEARDKVKSLKGQRDELMDQVHAATEKRLVTVIAVRNEKKKAIEYWHGGQVRETRPMTEDEIIEPGLPLDESSLADAQPGPSEQEPAGATAEGPKAASEAKPTKKAKRGKSAKVQAPPVVNGEDVGADSHP